MTRLHSTTLDQDDIAVAAAELLTDRLPVEPAITAAESVARHRKIWPELGELGWFDLLAREEHDGLGLHPADVGPLFRSIGRRLAPGPLGASVFVVPWLTARPATVAPSLRSARGRVAAVVDHAGSARADQGEPLRLSDGRLTGAVRAVPHGADADVFVVVARTVRGDETIVVVPADAPNIVWTRHEAVDPCWSFADVAFYGSPIDAEQVIDTSPSLPAELRAWLRILLSCEISGLVAEVLDLTVEFVQARHQFGRPIGSFQAIKHRLADMSANVTLLENLTALTLAEAADSSPTELDDAAVTLKSVASRTGIQVCESALQAHGGIGFTAEYPLHWYLKRALTLSGYYGDTRELNSRIGRRALGID